MRAPPGEFSALEHQLLPHHFCFTGQLNDILLLTLLLILQIFREHSAKFAITQPPSSFFPPLLSRTLFLDCNSFNFC